MTTTTRPGLRAWMKTTALVLAPLLMAGLLMWGLWDPSSRLPQITAAVVNNDKGATVDGENVPYGRELANELITNGPGGITWELTDTAGATAGTDDGTYAAVVTIPEDFSDRAMSTVTTPTRAEQARIDVALAPTNRPGDDLILQTVNDAAVAAFNRSNAKLHLDNVYIAFGDIHHQLTDASTGASQLADGAGQSATGAGELATGAGELSTGASQLSTGASDLKTGTGELSTGAATLLEGLQQLSTGATTAKDGAISLADGASTLATGSSDLHTNLVDLTGGVDLAATSTAGAATQLDQLAPVLAQLQGLESCDFTTDPECVTQLLTALEQLPDEDALTQFATNIYTANAALNGDPANGVPTGAAEGLHLATDGAKDVTDGASTLSTGATDLTAGLTDLETGAQSAVTGATELNTGASQVATGANDLASGASELNTGAGDLSTGAGDLAEGTQQVADGAAELSANLAEAPGQVPNYTDTERAQFIDAASQPVLTDESGNPTNDLTFPLIAALALWAGAFAIFAVRRPLPITAASSTRSPLRTALRAAVPALVVAAVQAIAVTVLLAATLGFTATQGLSAFLLLMVGGLAFTLLLQGLIALFGRAGIILAAIAAIVTGALGVISTTPALLHTIDAASPLGALARALVGVVTNHTNWSVLATLLLWAAAGTALTVLAIRRLRRPRLPALT